MPLSLSRRQSESVQIGDDIVITISNIKNGKVTLQVDAPKRMKVLRSEIASINPKKSLILRFFEVLSRLSGVIPRV